MAGDDGATYTSGSLACALQSCLASNTYNQEKCDRFVKELYRCCYEMYKKEGRNAESTACPMQNVVESWVKRHPDANVG